MNKIFLIAIVIILGIGSLSAQQDSDTETNIITQKIDGQDITIKAGGRVSFDGAHYINDKMDMSSGVQIGEARLNMFTSFGNQFDVKIDLDFAKKEITFRDIYARWNINKNSSLRIGYYMAPFSMEKTASSLDRFFISPAATVNALTLDRRLGISYRVSNSYLWGEGGVFGGNVYQKESGDDSWGTSARIIFNPQITDHMTLHVGGGVSYRNADPNGFKNGDDNHNRYIRYSSNAETAVDNTRLIDANVEYANKELRFNVEAMLVAERFFVQTELTTTKVSRKRDNQRLFEEQLGGMWSLPNLEAWEKWYGKDLRDVSFKGAYIQAGYLIRGSKYKYDRFQAINRPSRDKGAIEVIARYNHTSLNDIDGIWYNGRFYDPAKGPGMDDPNFNYSIGGGRMNSYTLGVNYYVNKYARFMFDYGYQRIGKLDLMDNYVHTLQTRLQISF